MEISNLCFDFGNVLIDIDIEGAKHRLFELMQSGHDPEKVHAEIEHLIREYEVDEISTREFLDAMKAMARPEIEDDTIINAWNSMLLGIPQYRFGMLELLKENYNVFLLSNTNSLHIDWVHHYLRDTYQIMQFEKTFFDDHYYSYEIGKRKPDSEYFLHVIDDAMITPARSLFIDDIEENVRAARQLGFQTIHLRPEEEIAEVLKLKSLY